MDFTTLEPAVQWIITNIVIIWLYNLCSILYSSSNEPFTKDQTARIQDLEKQNKVIYQALEKLNDRFTIPVRRDEILGLRFEIACLTADLQKHKIKHVNRRRIIESSDDEE
jgi:hypothetical protein